MKKKKRKTPLNPEPKLATQILHLKFLMPHVFITGKDSRAFLLPLWGHSLFMKVIHTKAISRVASSF